LGLKVLDLNTEGFLKILGPQKLLPEVSVGCNLPLGRFGARIERQRAVLVVLERLVLGAEGITAQPVRMEEMLRVIQGE
jgi:hypothetical protein